MDAIVNRRGLKYLAVGTAGGIFSGLTGLGGGMVMLPLLVGVLGLSQHKAHATSLAIIIPTALAAGWVYAAQGYIDWLLAVEMALGSTLGVILGAKVMTRIPARALRVAFGLLLLVIAVQILFFPRG